MPDGSSCVSAHTKARAWSQAELPCSKTLGTALHYGEIIPSAKVARKRVADFLGLAVDDTDVPFIALPKAAECDAESSIEVFLEQRQLILDGFAKTENNVCYVYSPETPVHCLDRSTAKTKRAYEIYDKGLVCFLYKNGCQKSDFDDHEHNQFMPERFDVSADELEAERQRQRDEFKRRALILLASSDLPLVDAEDKSDLYFEAAHGRPKYTVWSTSPEFEAVKVTRKAKRTIESVPVTKFFEMHWPTFDGEKTDLKYDPSLYSVVNKLKGRGFTDYLSCLREHLKSLQG